MKEDIGISKPTKHRNKIDIIQVLIHVAIK